MNGLALDICSGPAHDGGMTSTGEHPANTPGYNTRLRIFFQATRTGRKTAYRWDWTQARAFRMPLLDAELFIAQGQATQLDGHPLKCHGGAR